MCVECVEVMTGNDVVVLSPVQIVNDVINSLLDDIFPAEKAASDVISALLDRVVTKHRGTIPSVCQSDSGH